MWCIAVASSDRRWRQGRCLYAARVDLSDSTVQIPDDMHYAPALQLVHDTFIPAEAVQPVEVGG